MLFKRENRWLLPGAALAAIFTILIFLTASSNQFVEFDDFGYIVDNRHIDQLNWQTVVWAFADFHEANWHPLTMLSLAFDRQLWGLNPFGFHLTNILLHSGTVFVCCFVFAAMLRLVWGPAVLPAQVESHCPRSLSVAAASIAGALFFGLHPLRVESVVWASERKDVLCIFFVVAAFWAYFRYHAQQFATPENRPLKISAYWLLLAMASLAMMSKPTAVSLPILLLIFDWYPLRRVVDRRSLYCAIVEKTPLLLMAAVTAWMTVLAQQEPLARSASLTLSSKVLVASKALFWYLWRTLWPTGLAPLHPHPGNVADNVVGEYLLYAAGVVGISGVVAVLGKRQKIWAALWLYFLVALVPMLGVVHVGRQWVADRYSYLPGLAVALLWGGGIVWLFNRLRHAGHRCYAMTLAVLAGCQLVACLVVTLQSISWWRTTETIASREIDVYPRQVGVVYFARAKYRNEHGNYAAALVDVEEALGVLLRKQIKDKYLPVSLKRAEILRNLGRVDEALVAVEWGIQASGETVSAEAVTLREELMKERAGLSAAGNQ